MLLPEVRTWAEWGRMFTDVSQWMPAVHEICRRESISYHRMEAGYPGTNAVFVVDQSWVVKIYAPFCKEDLAIEKELCLLLSHNPYIPVPRLLAVGTLPDRIEWPYIVMDYVPGQPIREARSDIAPGNRLEIASALGHIVRELHSTSLAEIHSLDTSWAGWQRFLHQRMTGCVEELRASGVVPASVLGRIPAFLQGAISDCPQSPLVLLNGDLTEDHLLVSKKGDRWRISGLIDLADSMIGERDYEWVALWVGALDRDGECMRAFMSAYDPAIVLDEAFLDRALAFTFLHEFGPLCIKGMLQGREHPAIDSIEQLRSALWGSLTRPPAKEDRWV